MGQSTVHCLKTSTCATSSRVCVVSTDLTPMAITIWELYCTEHFDGCSLYPCLSRDRFKKVYRRLPSLSISNGSEPWPLCVQFHNAYEQFILIFSETRTWCPVEARPSGYMRCLPFPEDRSHMPSMSLDFPPTMDTPERG